ncbi:MAG: hypothetical protein HZB55_06195 [Deltaproteobacteria bacterium]|nr:hypothetical protein [Deltaproteobacteria bacterium]
MASRRRHAKAAAARSPDVAQEGLHRGIAEEALAPPHRQGQHLRPVEAPQALPPDPFQGPGGAAHELALPPKRLVEGLDLAHRLAEVFRGFAPEPEEPKPRPPELAAHGAVEAEHVEPLAQEPVEAVQGSVHRLSHVDQVAQGLEIAGPAAVDLLEALPHGAPVAVRLDAEHLADDPLPIRPGVLAHALEEVAHLSQHPHRRAAAARPDRLVELSAQALQVVQVGLDHGG